MPELSAPAGGIDLESAARILVRLAVALILGGALGWERERRNRNAGLRTHMLVGLGAALFTAVPVELRGAQQAELEQIVKGIAAGVGFLGAGTILKREAPGHASVHGLTTAANIWMTAAIGFAVGAGMLVTAGVATAFAFLVLNVLRKVETDPGSEPRKES